MNDAKQIQQCSRGGMTVNMCLGPREQKQASACLVSVIVKNRVVDNIMWHSHIFMRSLCSTHSLQNSK